MKRILITGKDSYIGTSFEKWVSRWPEEYHADTLDTKGYWQSYDFSPYDVVFHVAGIAHVDAKDDMEAIITAPAVKIGTSIPPISVAAPVKIP